MSNEKQQLISAIKTLPDELTGQALQLIKQLQTPYIEDEAPESVTINKQDLQEKLQEGLDDIKANRVYSLEEFFGEIDKM